MMSLPQPDPTGYGPLGTPNAGRVERMARADRADAIRYRAAAERRERDADTFDAAEVRSLCAETRRLRDQLADVRRELAHLRAELPDRISAQLADELPNAHALLHARPEILRNGTPDRR